MTHSGKAGRGALALSMTAALVFAGVVSPQAAFAAEGDPLVVDVSAHGIHPNTGEDAATAIRAAIAEAKAHTANGGSAIVRFPQGRYDIFPEMS
ncbi:hypothetical protein [Schaalia sp. Marseille-Q2122]|uniref:hypothetical protein n=1 Tax=Schaalia sp. Marseille-Q2122 TaxID=2736604 RepID=UPI00158ED6EB|nr:hypothetical protein [Schaalia sp. Marseille-Q2122]